MHTSCASNTISNTYTKSNQNLHNIHQPMFITATGQMDETPVDQSQPTCSHRPTQTGHLIRSPILLVSNASVSIQHTRTSVWAICSTTQLWSSEGIVPSTPNELYLGLAEVYSVLTVLKLLPKNIIHKMFNQAILQQSGCP